MGHLSTPIFVPGILEGKKIFDFGPLTHPVFVPGIIEGFKGQTHGVAPMCKVYVRIRNVRLRQRPKPTDIERNADTAEERRI